MWKPTKVISPITKIVKLHPQMWFVDYSPIPTEKPLTVMGKAEFVLVL